MEDIIGGLLDASPPLVLGLALYVLGIMLKVVPWIQNWCIPFILAGAGFFIYPMVSEVGKVSYSVRSPWMLNALIGFGIGGGAVLADQMRKQWAEFKGAKAQDGTTRFFKKPKASSKPIPPEPAPPTDVAP